MLNDEDRKEAVRLLLEAEGTVTPTTQLDKTFPGIEIADSYAIQQEVIRIKMQAGAKLRGHKVGLTSKAMQATVGINEPDYGHLLDDMFYNDGDTIVAERFIAPRVEVELAFVLGKPLKGPGVTMFDVLSATEYVVPTLELIDGHSRYPRRIVDNIADNAAAAGVIEETSVSAAVLGHPAMGVVWLANKLGEFGTTLEAGHVVLAGSFTRTVAVAKGDTILADYGPLGNVAVHFS